MFGYVRPNKAELLVREFTRYRSVYCGICKEIGRTYGQLPRIALTYDITMLGVFLISLMDETPNEKMEACILNPLLKKPFIYDNEAIRRCAALSVLLTASKFQDEIQDGSRITGHAGALVMRRARGKASKKYPADAVVITDGMKNIRNYELQETENPDCGYAAELFGVILQDLFGNAFQSFFPNIPDREKLIDGVKRMGFYLGKWIFILDAIDDYEKDKEKGNWNPFCKKDADNARQQAEQLLLDCEMQIDLIAALLPYNRDAGIISNIVQQGLPLIRQKVFQHEKLVRL